MGLEPNPKITSTNYFDDFFTEKVVVTFDYSEVAEEDKQSLKNVETH
jgi:hypothetical protein